MNNRPLKDSTSHSDQSSKSSIDPEKRNMENLPLEDSTRHSDGSSNSSTAPKNRNMENLPLNNLADTIDGSMENSSPHEGRSNVGSSSSSENVMNGMSGPANQLARGEKRKERETHNENMETGEDSSENGEIGREPQSKKRYESANDVQQQQEQRGSTSVASGVSTPDTSSTTELQTNRRNLAAPPHPLPIKNAAIPRPPPVAGSAPSGCRISTIPPEYKMKKFPYKNDFGIPSDLANIDIIVTGNYSGPQNFEFVSFQKEYTCRIPKDCFGARKGLNGYRKFPQYRNFPGIPTEKLFDISEIMSPEQAEYDDAEYQVQAVYSKRGDSSKLLMAFAGWDCGSVQEAERNSLFGLTFVIKMYNIREKFLTALKARLPQRYAEIIDNHRFLWGNLCLDPHNKFWLFEDLTYFHSKLNEEKNQNAVIYMSFSNKTPSLQFSFSPINVLDAKTLEYFLRKISNRPFCKLPGSKKWSPVKTNNKRYKRHSDTPCQKWATNCKCNFTFDILYGHDSSVINLIPNDEGILNLDNITTDSRKIVMECSDACGCSSSCPRRQMQRGQQKALIVFREGNKQGFGVRIAEKVRKGEFIAEYTGRLFLQNVERSQTMEESDDEFESEEDGEEWDTDESLNDDAGDDANFAIGDLDGDSDEDVPESDDDEHTEGTEPIKDSTYEAENTIMDNKVVTCALHIGNATRFINHGCLANCIFIETHSRRNEKEPLIPRIAVYATKDMEPATKLSISYYKNKKYPSTSGIKCGCGAKRCMQYFPLMKEAKKNSSSEPSTSSK